MGKPVRVQVPPRAPIQGPPTQAGLAFTRGPCAGRHEMRLRRIEEAAAPAGAFRCVSMAAFPRRTMNLTEEIGRRRTFAIIAHPDAGKTTLTEKFLLYGGAIQLAGSVTARKNQRAATSDWMELEKKRGISISSTVLQFDYAGYRINLLDTPGHKDFSEDTYRVLTAVDAVVMVIDAGKGIE